MQPCVAKISGKLSHAHHGTGQTMFQIPEKDDTYNSSISSRADADLPLLKAYIRDVTSETSHTQRDNCQSFIGH